MSRRRVVTLSLELAALLVAAFVCICCAQGCRCLEAFGACILEECGVAGGNTDEEESQGKTEETAP